MSYKKSELVLAALAEIGLSDYAFDISTEQLDQGLARLDAMMAEWGGRGIRLGYPIAAGPKDVDANQDSGIPDVAYEAVVTNLAMRLSASYGMTIKPQTAVIATRGLNTLLTIAARPGQARLGPMLAGAGSKLLVSPIIESPDSTKVDRPEDSVVLE